MHVVLYALCNRGPRPVTQPGVTPRFEAFFGGRKTTNLCSESALCPAWPDAWQILRPARGTPESKKTAGVGHPSVPLESSTAARRTSATEPVDGVGV